ncbi:MAG: VWA domain-containing protein [Planctomycetes bacterium]|nr:VWA domain-containing protein [Planctomycetota bacterium]
MEFYSPWLLLLLLVVPVAAFIEVWRRGTAGVRFSSLGVLKASPVSLRLRFRWLLKVLRYGCLVLLIVALARPRKGTELLSISTEGVAMEIVVDRSSSMKAQMLYEERELDRLAVSKFVIKDFVAGGNGLKGRPQDLIGLITFARYADTTCPLVHGHNVLLEFLAGIKHAVGRNEDGTAIGDALALAGARLKKAEEEIIARNKKFRKEAVETGDKQADEFKIKSKVIVLLTDGKNTAGQYRPLQAAQLVKEWGIKVYTIGIAPKIKRLDIFSMLQVSGVDERLLKQIAQTTGGFYARAANGEELLKIYEEIDKLEKTEVKSLEFTSYAEQFGDFALGGLVLLGLEVLLGCTVFRKIP